MAPPPKDPSSYPKSLGQAGGKEVKTDHDALKNIVKLLQQDLDDLKSKRLKESLEDSTISQANIGNYTAGRGLYMTVSNAQNHISGTYDGFLTAYQNVINAIKKSETNTKTADENSEKRVRDAGRVD